MFSKELLETYLSIKHFRYILEGCKFMMYTYHKPLIYALQTTFDKYTPHKIWHLDFISQHTSDMRFISNKGNTITNKLSQKTISTSTSDTLSHKVIAEKQKKSNKFLQVWENTSLKLIKFPVPFGDVTLMWYYQEQTMSLCTTIIKKNDLPSSSWETGHNQSHLQTCHMA